MNNIKAKKVLSDDDLFSVFGNITVLAEHHKKFLSHLNERISNWKETSTVGDLFIDHFTFIDQYRIFIENYNASFAAVHYLTKKNKTFNQVLEVSRIFLKFSLILLIEI